MYFITAVFNLCQFVWSQKIIYTINMFFPLRWSIGMVGAFDFVFNYLLYISKEKGLKREKFRILFFNIFHVFRIFRITFNYLNKIIKKTVNGYSCPKSHNSVRWYIIRRVFDFNFWNFILSYNLTWNSVRCQGALISRRCCYAFILIQSLWCILLLK